MKKQLIIVAGGKGKRMNSETPKQFLIIGGKPVLMHTIEKFYNFSSELKILLVLPANHFDYWKSLCKKYNFNIPHSLVEGGETRFHSVKNGLERVIEDCIVAIHDGVRPLVSKKTISESFEMAEKQGNAIPVIGINESIRIMKDGESQPVNRDDYLLIQTPQCFHSSLIKKGYSQNFEDEFTDDATVIEALGTKINLTKGNAENIKITRTIDLKIADALLLPT